MKYTLVLAALLTALTLPAHAQQIVAQSNYVNRTAQAAVPQISITIRADFVLFSVRYITATRAIDARTAELTRMFQTVTQRVQRNSEGISIEVGQPGNSAALETASLKEVIVKTQNDQSAWTTPSRPMCDRQTPSRPSAPGSRSLWPTRPSMDGSRPVIGDSQFLAR